MQHATCDPAQGNARYRLKILNRNKQPTNENNKKGHRVKEQGEENGKRRQYDRMRKNEWKLRDEEHKANTEKGKEGNETRMTKRKKGRHRKKNSGRQEVREGEE